jgi:hypothetical protein
MALFLNIFRYAGWEEAYNENKETEDDCSVQ